jgi:hypothetical protein
MGANIHKNSPPNLLSREGEGVSHAHNVLGSSLDIVSLSNYRKKMKME